MKKIFLLSILFTSFVSMKAQTFTATPSTATSGDVISIKGSGESNSAYFSSISRWNTSDKKPDGSATSTYMTMSSPSSINTFVPGGTAPTSFQVTVTNNSTTSYVADFAFLVNISSFPGSTQTGVVKYVRVTVNPKPVLPTNDMQTKTFTKSCDAGYQAEPTVYTVEAGKYSGATKAEANAKAVADINANGQNAANAKPCKLVYYNDAITESFRRNDCGASGFGSELISYTIPANTKSSLVSKDDANNQARASLNIEGQATANNTGTCVIVPITGPSSFCTGDKGVFSIDNLPAGITVLSWTGKLGTRVLSSNNNKVTVGYEPSFGYLKGNITANLSNGATISKNYTYTTCGTSPD